jgi:predicted Zn-dependent protease
MATAAPSQPARKRRALWPLLVGAGVLLWFGAIAAYLVGRDKPAPKPEPFELKADTSKLAPEDRALANGIVNIFGQALEKIPDKNPPKYTTAPTTASGWLELAATQPPAEAVHSIRQALALSPSWLDAQIALCAALAASKDAGAIAACEVALRRKPDDVALLAAHGAALLYAGDAKAALVDLDRVVAADPDPKWRRLRARARSASGDTAGAQKDLEHACQLGDAAACNEKR